MADGNGTTSTGSRFGEITRDFADGTYRFRLAIGQIRELETKQNAGAPEILLRMSLGRFRVDDIRETVRLALIGGGDVDPIKAKKLVEDYVDQRPYFETLKLAVDVLGEVLNIPEDAIEKKVDEIDPNEILDLITGQLGATAP